MSSLDSILFTRRKDQLAWFQVILENLPDSLIELSTEFISYFDDGDTVDYFPCPDEVEWFKKRGLKFTFECIGDCSLCLTQFLLDPKAYEFTTLGGDDPFLDTIKKISV